MNNKGAVWGLWIVLLLVLALGAGGYIAYNQGLFAQKVTGGIDPALSATDCETAPSVSVTAIDTLSKSTTLTATSQFTTHARVNGNFVGSIPSTLQKGDKVEVLVNATNYINDVIPEFAVACGNNIKTMELYATDALTYKVKDEANTLTDGVTSTTTNATNIALGGSDTYDVFITGIDKKSSGDLIFAVEIGSSANVSDITMTDTGGNVLEEVTRPDFYALTLTSPELKFFKIPAIVNAVEKQYKLTVSAESSKDISGAVYTTIYSEEYFLNVDGTFMKGVEDSDGTVKYEDTYDYDFYINPV